MRRSIGFSLLILCVLCSSVWAGPPCPDCCSPEYDNTVMNSYRKLMFKDSVYGNIPEMGKGIRLGVYQAQADCGPGASAKNMDRLESVAGVAKKRGVQLLSFPELYVTGYTLSPEQARKVAEFKDGPSITRACSIAKKMEMALIVPYAEKAETKSGLRYFDSIAIINEHGKLLDSYRKVQLYAGQERDNWSFGDVAPKMFKVFGFPVGVLNCYENEFPELVRSLALQGAKLIVGPTAADCYYTMPNGKRSDVPYPDISTLLLPAFAYANNVFYAYSNRAGYERRETGEWHYRGNSIIIGPHGDVIVKAGHQQDTMLIADIVPEYYGATHPEQDYYYLKDRRPDLYKELLKSKVDFLKGGYVYPVYKDGKEIPR
ncbi:carbon-nitrogen hydrolase family protein [Maridesulfovibrio sp.]|uniref:carbon-nitrogen hydrolase family protein n=1 Tax=Maridesulfovibrio sp. TaxID=2795000 RepID=UPI0029C9CF14|nr:carbon-nitrogen hydrolase family protein [Maridesulfovibrio sp.]